MDITTCGVYAYTEGKDKMGLMEEWYFIGLTFSNQLLS